MASAGPTSAKDDIERVEDANVARQIPGIAGDKAAQFLEKNPEGRVTVTPEEDKRVLRKIDMVILPIMLMVYFLQGLDKATLAYASVFGLLSKYPYTTR